MGELLLDNINSDKLAKSIDLGIDVLDSANLQQVENLNSVLNEVYGPLSTETCTLVPLPPMSIVDRFVTIALDKVDAQKLQAFQKMWNPSLETLKKTETSICLPPTRAALDKMALAQAEVGRSFGKQEVRSFASYTGQVLQTSITSKKVLALAEDAKAVAPKASTQLKKDFTTAGKKAEAAAKLEIARNKVAAKQTR